MEKEETRELTQPLKTLATLPEDPCPVANTHTEQLTTTNSSPWALDSSSHMWHTQRNTYLKVKTKKSTETVVT